MSTLLARKNWNIVCRGVRSSQLLSFLSPTEDAGCLLSEHAPCCDCLLSYCRITRKRGRASLTAGCTKRAPTSVLLTRLRASPCFVQLVEASHPAVTISAPRKESVQADHCFGVGEIEAWCKRRIQMLAGDECGLLWWMPPAFPPPSICILDIPGNTGMFKMSR